MTQEQLQERIQKSNIKIEKIEKRIKKWQDAQTEDACVKHYDYELSWGKQDKKSLMRIMPTILRIAIGN